VQGFYWSENELLISKMGYNCFGVVMDDSYIYMREGQRFVANAYKNLGFVRFCVTKGKGGMSMNITCKYCTFCGNWTNDYLGTGDQKPIRYNRSGIYFWSPVKKKKSILKAHSHQIFLRYLFFWLYTMIAPRSR
jgi:hypothetical protein